MTADDPKTQRIHPLLRGLAAIGCLASAVVAVLAFPTNFFATPQYLIMPGLCIFVTVYLGVIAFTGRAIRWPWER